MVDRSLAVLPQSEDAAAEKLVPVPTTVNRNDNRDSLHVLELRILLDKDAKSTVDVLRLRANDRVPCPKLFDESRLDVTPRRVNLFTERYPMYHDVMPWLVGIGDREAEVT